jgi:hypothetical protein
MNPVCKCGHTLEEHNATSELCIRCRCIGYEPRPTRILSAEELARDSEPFSEAKHRREQSYNYAAYLILSAANAYHYIKSQELPFLDKVHGCALIIDGIQNALDAAANGEEWRTNRWYRTDREIQDGTGIRPVKRT